MSVGCLRASVLSTLHSSVKIEAFLNISRGFSCNVFRSNPGAAGSELRVLERPELFDDARNLGGALDLVGAYLKNYLIDKADTVMSLVSALRQRAV